jgi:hypothetical protein
MRRTSEPEERAQFTVAELLARYGESAPTTGRRHRRAADPPSTATDPGPQPTELSGSDSPQVSSTRGDSPSGDLFQSTSTHDRSTMTQPHLNGLAAPGWAPAVGPPTVGAGRAPVTSQMVTRRASLTGVALSDGPVTDQLPRCDPMPVDPHPWSSRPASAHPTTTQPPSAQPPAGLGTSPDIPEQIEHATAADEAPTQESVSPWWEWTLMVSQIGIGVVGGAALWLICEWLWQRTPVVALIVALAVITGLVWIVRRVRRAEDLQTTVVAVLVGLFVTVSPAALLLVGR